MIPSTRELAMQIAVMLDMYPKETISQIAGRLMFSPIFLINAVEEGVMMGLYKRVPKTDKLKATAPPNYDCIGGLDLGRENTRLQDEILRTISIANSDQADVESGTLMMWCRGIKEAELEMAIRTLEKIQFITSYELVNPKDVKSMYKFYTLKINAGKDWGSKQFTSNKKA